MGEKLHRILEERHGSFVSGEEIGSRLGISRAGVWKRVKVLRGAGYGIEGARGAGYRLTDTPDRLSEVDLRARLRPAGPWAAFVLLDVTDSTNRVAMEMAERSAPHRTGRSSSRTRRPRAGAGGAAAGCRPTGRTCTFPEKKRTIAGGCIPPTGMFPPRSMNWNTHRRRANSRTLPVYSMGFTPN
jgi:biotin operon repressor BirA-like protein